MFISMHTSTYKKSKGSSSSLPNTYGINTKFLMYIIYLCSNTEKSRNSKGNNRNMRTRGGVVASLVTLPFLSGRFGYWLVFVIQLRVK